MAACPAKKKKKQFCNYVRFFNMIDSEKLRQRSRNYIKKFYNSYKAASTEFYAYYF